MIRLFTTSYPEPDAPRAAEHATCLRRNLECAALAEVCLLAEGDVVLPSDVKLRVRRIGRRPRYADYFAWIDELAGPEDISVVANGDIFFDRQLAVLRRCVRRGAMALALARWDVGSAGEARLNDRNDSQDTWVFRGRVTGVDGDFPVGVPRCDNRLLFELQTAGLQVLNPAFSIRTYHLHAGQRGEYATSGLPHFVPPPYRYLWPHNLWSLPRTALHNLRHRDERVGWRFDRRRGLGGLMSRLSQRLARARA